MPRRQVCNCSKEMQQICKPPPGTLIASGPDAIAATLELEMYQKKMARTRPPKLKLKQYKPLRAREKAVPMHPPMYTRLKYIHHCDPEPMKRRFLKKPRIRYTEDVLSSEDEAEKKKRLKREQQLVEAYRKCRICMPEGPKQVKHADSDQSIIHVPSPKLSGQFISVQRAPLNPNELKPPLPAKSGFDLYKPHSGIVINQDKDYAPEGMAGGRGNIKSLKKKKVPACAKGGVCTRKKCRRRKCRKFAALRRRQMMRAARTGRPARIRSCTSRHNKYALDGKPRAKYLRSGIIPRDDTGCGLDDVERPDYPEIPGGLKRGAFRTHSLTIVPCTKDKRPDVHYGILMGTFNLFSDRFGKSRGRQGLPMSIMAYCLAYHYHPKQWNSKFIDSLMVAGDQWYTQLLEKLHDHSAYQGICEVVPFGKQKVVILNKKKMQVLLCEPEIVGYAMSLDPTVYNLCRGLKAFFSCPDTRACILMTRSLKIAVWRDKVCYFVFDPAGRDAKAYSNFAVGNAALINVLDLNSVIDVLLARSIIEDQKFVLAPIKVLAMVSQTADDDLDSEPEPNQAEKAKMSYRILSQNLAIVNANLHLGDIMFEDTKFQQALTIAVAALTYAKISPPNTWYSKTLDKIIRIGNKLYVDFKNPKITFELGIDNIPNEIVVGPYNCEIIIYRDRTKGQLFTTKGCILNIKTGLQDFFSHEYNSGILDFNNYKLAVWRQKDMFYLFDPYPRTNDGERAMKAGKACCLMLLDTDAMADAFTKNWDFLPATTQFYIHAFKVLRLSQKKPKNQLTVSLSATKRKRRHRRPRRQVLPAGSAVSVRAAGSRSGASGVSAMSGPSGASGTTGASGRPSHTTTVMTAVGGAGAGGAVGAAGDHDKQYDEEYMGEIVSLVDSIQEDFIPPVPLKYKNMEPEPEPVKFHDLDSPTVSVTQVVPPWPKPRDKTNEPPDRDPDPEPTPPPTPPPPIPPEGAEEEEEEEEELDEEELKRKKEEEKRRKAEEEEARRRAEMLPPPIPPPPPTPLLEDEGAPQRPARMRGESTGVTSAAGGGPADGGPGGGPGSPGGIGGGPGSVAGAPGAAGAGAVGPGGAPGTVGPGGPEGAAFKGAGGAGLPGPGGEIDMQEDDIIMEPVAVERYVLLTEDAKKRYTMRQRHKAIALPVEEPKEEPPYLGPDGKIITTKQHNFSDLLDSSQIIRAGKGTPNKEATMVLPFVAVMAVVTSYKYSIDTWTRALVDFVVDSGKKLSDKKKKEFQACSLHILPKIAIGHEAYHANIDVVMDGPTWQLENILDRLFFPKYDRGILTTPYYSCALFKKNGLYYLFDGSECNAMGLRHLPDDNPEKKMQHKEGRACFMRFLKLRDLANRIQYNKGGHADESQFILSKLIIRRLLDFPRYKLPDDYDYEMMKARSTKSYAKIVEEHKEKKKLEDKMLKDKGKYPIGYQDFDGIMRVNGSTALPGTAKKVPGEVKPEHFVCLVAMLMATMHPINTWDSFMVDCCLETGLEIAKKASNLADCEKRVIKNVILDGKFINVNLKKIIVINENPDRYFEQYMKAVLSRLRYVLVRVIGCNLVIVQTGGVYHLFDPIAPPKDELPERLFKPKPEEPRIKKNRTAEEIEADLKREAEEKKKEEERLKAEERLRKEREKRGEKPAVVPPVAGWNMYRTLEGLIRRLHLTFQQRKSRKEDIDNPEFYTFELTAVKQAPRHAMFNYKLSPLFKPDEHPNQKYLVSRPPKTRVDEKMYWLNIPVIPWARSNINNDKGTPRGTPAAMWKAWDIEFPGDLYSLWGNVHPTDRRFPRESRGDQYLACCIVSCALVTACELSTWTSSFIDGIVIAGDKYHRKLIDKVNPKRNHEVRPEDYASIPGEIYPFKFTVAVENIIFGFVYNMLQDRFNLSNALAYFFEKHDMGLFVSPTKNFAFGKVKASYFMFESNSKGGPLFNKGAYILKCESLNRLIYCMTIALQLRSHNQKFHLYSIKVSLSEVATHDHDHGHKNASTTASEKSVSIKSEGTSQTATTKSSKSNLSDTKSNLSDDKSKVGSKSSKSNLTDDKSKAESTKSTVSEKESKESKPESTASDKPVK